MSTIPPLSEQSGRQVLVVEDEARVRGMLEKALGEMGFSGTFTGSAEAAGRILATKSFDILMLDLNLPGIGGLEFLERIRRQHPHTSVIILTGFGDLEAAKKAIHLDVVEFLTKPCALGTLEAALQRARERRRVYLLGQAIVSPAPDDASAGPPIAFAEPAGSASPETSIEEMERRHILAALERHKGNRAAAAAELGISVRKLYYRLGQYQKSGLFP
jgi:DNA-binding NtrC family response regulator